MSNNNYHKQVALLIKVIPEIALEPRFALHGGTAINLFDRDMPRLSVDIDLTYIPIEDRETSFTNISVTLTNIKSSIEKRLQGSRVEHKVELHKLLVSHNDAMIKIEVSQIVRGILDTVTEKILCKKAQEKFDTFCSINVVPKGQLYGGKVCAAMDRQHPRDIFDVKQLLQREGFTQEIKEGFLFRLLSSDRSIQDVLFPNLQDQRLAMTNQFTGMSEEQFTYEEYEFVRETMVKTVQASITEADKLFILGFKDVIPDWSIYNFEKYPSIKWKLQNLEKIKASNPAKHKELYILLKSKLDSI
ncbi:MAG: nucleotidyl transferase AbiEii/AbiGii toxin family protein [Chitinophagaceae bacterium]|nr:nucleotidyl transferase AbiEii/AbiGii toxin family protein [Chitinophagaceae bacterium]